MVNSTRNIARVMTTWLAVAWAFFPILGLCESFDLSPREYSKIKQGLFKDIRDASQQVIRHCPPPECIVIGIGRSPSTVISYLKELHPDGAIALPLSSFRHNPLAEAKEGIPPVFHKLPPQQERRLFQYFDQQLGDLLRKTPERVALLDYTITGESLYAMEAYFRKYLSEKKLNVTVEPLAMHAGASPARLEKSASTYGAKTATVIRIDPGSIYQDLLQGQALDIVAEFESFPLEDIDTRPRKNLHDLRLEFERDLRVFAKENPLPISAPCPVPLRSRLGAGYH